MLTPFPFVLPLLLTSIKKFRAAKIKVLNITAK